MASLSVPSDEIPGPKCLRDGRAFRRQFEPSIHVQCDYSRDDRRVVPTSVRGDKGSFAQAIAMGESSYSETISHEETIEKRAL